MAEGSEGWITYEVDLQINNPAIAKNYAEAVETWGEEDEATAALQAAGHDALILGGGDEIVVWDAGKIRILGKTK